MRISREKLLAESSSTGFRPDVLEKGKRSVKAISPRD
jgi:hypothetical protein